MIKTDAQIARLLGKADTFVARIDTKPKSEQTKLAQEGLNTLHRVYNDTNNKQLKHLIKLTVQNERIVSRNEMIKQIKNNIKQQKRELHRLSHNSNNYVSTNHDIVNDSFNIMDDIMTNVAFKSTKLNSYIQRKHDANA